MKTIIGGIQFIQKKTDRKKKKERKSYETFY